MQEEYVNDSLSLQHKANAFKIKIKWKLLKKMPEYKIIIRNGPPGYADTDEENVQVDNEEELAAAVKKACSYYSRVRRVLVFRNDGDTMTPVNARALHVLNGNVERNSF